MKRILTKTACVIAAGVISGISTMPCFAGDIEAVQKNYIKLKNDGSFSYECVVNMDTPLPYKSEWALSQIPENMRKGIVKTENLLEGKKSFFHIQERDRFYQQAYNPKTNSTFNMGWYFDGKKTHVITGIIISNGKIVKVNRKISDNVESGWHPVFVYPTSAMSAFPKLMESDLMSKFTQKPENIYVYDSANGIDRSILSGVEKVELEISKNSFNDIVRSSGIIKYRNNEFRVSEFSLVGGYRLPSKYEQYIIDDKIEKMRRTYDVVSLTEMKNKKFFEELNALDIADVYDQDTQKSYKLNNKMSFLTRLIDSKAIFGSIFVISFVTIFIFVYKKFKK
jgi:hypothetical protein